MKIHLILCSILLAFCSCATGSVIVEKPYGEYATITSWNNQTYACELLAIQDSLLFYQTTNGYNVEDMRGIKRIDIHGYNDRSLTGKSVACCFMGSIEALLAIVAMDVGQTNWTVAAGAGMLGTTITFLGTNEHAQINFIFPITDKSLQALRLYCRYPQGLTAEQWDMIKASNAQVDDEEWLDNGIVYLCPACKKKLREYLPGPCCYCTRHTSCIGNKMCYICAKERNECQDCMVKRKKIEQE